MLHHPLYAYVRRFGGLRLTCLVLVCASLCFSPGLFSFGPFSSASFALSGVAQAAERQPLLQAGKKTLFERVVSHPGALLYSAASGAATVMKDPVKTFTAFYVYGRQGTRLEVGVSSTRADGWLEAPQTTAWPQAITMLLTDRTTRMPVLFFKDHQGLVSTCTSEQLDALVRSYRATAEQARTGTAVDPQFPVLAMEPADNEGAVARSRFYLMPVLNMDGQFQATKLIEVASIDPGTDSNKKNTEAQGSAADQHNELRTGIAFVIDTTISMRPYIEQTLAVVRDIYDKLEKSPNGDKVAFAVVAYRNSVKASPGLEYDAKVVSDFKTVKDRKSLEAALSSVREASKSSHSVDEDALGGVKQAVDQLSWNSFGSRVMLLVGDAGPLLGSDRYSSTQMDPAEMADYLRTHNIWLTALHVKAPKGKSNHASAEKAYRELSRLADGSASYIPIDATTVEKGAKAFDRTGKALADSYGQLVDATASGKMLAKPVVQQVAEDPETRARQLAAISGYAMQLEFFGSQRSTKAPNVVSAWIADADLELLAKNPEVPVMAVEPAVLLTKNQLSDLTAQLKLVIDQATRSQRLGGTDFFESLISMAAQLTRDPSRFSHTPGQNLAQAGVLGEFLDGLPYKSDILGMTEQDWYNKSVGEQTQFINRLKSRIARYQEYDRDRTNWESFGSPNAGDWVYRVPLSMLP